MRALRACFSSGGRAFSTENGLERINKAPAPKKRSRSHVRLPVLMSDWTTGCSDVSIGRCETA